MSSKGTSKKPEKEWTRGDTDITEDELLADFCRDVVVSEIDYDAWMAISSQLDLQIPVRISPQFAAHGGSLAVKFHRQVTVSKGMIKRVEKEAVECQIIVPPNCQNGHTVEVPKAGDRSEKRVGNLRIFIEIC